MLLKQHVKTTADQNGNSRHAWVVFDLDAVGVSQKLATVYPHSVEPEPPELDGLPVVPGWEITPAEYAALVRQGVRLDYERRQAATAERLIMAGLHN